MSERFSLFRSIAQQLLERGQNPLSDVATTAETSRSGGSEDSSPVGPVAGPGGGGRVLTPTMARWVEGAG